MKISNKELIKGVEKRDFRLIARLITLCENRIARSREILRALPQPKNKTQIIGVTGSPGAGKSSLVDQLVAALTKEKKTVAVIAIDPSSPFSGGAVLGDRIRMTNALESKDVFIRSMATRGALGGISRGTHDAIRILESAAFDYVIIETVGVGQAEVDIVRSADTCVVVLVPGMGDSVQALKAGVLEIADIFAINKSDLPGTDILEKDIRVLLGLVEGEAGGWIPPIERTVATEGIGVTELVDALKAHHEWLTSSPSAAERRVDLTKQRVLQILIDDIRERVETECSEELNNQAKAVMEKSTDVGDAVNQLEKHLKKKL